MSRAVAPLDHLVQIDRLVEGPQPLGLGGVDLGDAQRGRELQLRHPDARALQPLEPALRVLVLDRRVADVVADAEVAMQRLLGFAPAEAAEVRQPGDRGIGEQVPLEEPHGLLDGLEKAVRLGLEGERDHAAGARLQPHQMRGVPDHVVGDALGDARCFGERLEGAGHRADAAFEARLVGQQVGQQIRQEVGVDQPLLVLPVRLVDLLLDPHAVEGAVGKAVDREHVEVVRVQQAAQLREARADRAAPRAATADSRRPTPNRRSGAKAALTAGR